MTAPSYTQRPHPLASEVTFTLTPTHLEWSDAKGRSGRFALAHAARLRLSYDPARIRTPRHVLDLNFGHYGEIRLTSSSYRGMGLYKSCADSFNHFTQELHIAIKAAAPACHFETGRGWSFYIANMSGWVFLGGLFAVGIVGFALKQQWALAGLLAAMLAYIAPAFIKVARVNIPTPYDPRHIPSHALPTPEPQS